jgi:hypothetical protein
VRESNSERGMGKTNGVVLPFDRITLLEGSTDRDLPLDELRGYTLNQRVRLILENRVQFWRGAERVSNVVALRALQEAARK